MAEYIPYTFKVRSVSTDLSPSDASNNTSLLNKSSETGATGSWTTDGHATRHAFTIANTTTQTLTFASMGLTAAVRTNFIVWAKYATGTTMANQHVEIELNNSGATDLVIEAIGAGTATSQLEITNNSGGTVDIEIVFFVRST